MEPHIKRRLSLASLLILFILYYLGTDPDTKIFQNLPFGSSLILTINIFIIAITGIIVIEFIPDYFIDVIYGKEKDLRIEASKTSQGAGYALIAKSIRLLGYGIILAASIISYNVS